MVHQCPRVPGNLAKTDKRLGEDCMNSPAARRPPPEGQTRRAAGAKLVVGGITPMAEENADRDAIIELIHRNRIAIWTNDFDLWNSCFVHEPYLVRWGWWSGGGAFMRRGWDEISGRVRQEGGMPPYSARHAY